VSSIYNTAWPLDSAKVQRLQLFTTIGGSLTYCLRHSDMCGTLLLLLQPAYLTTPAWHWQAYISIPYISMESGLSD
jgi:hypothetical protein